MKRLLRLFSSKCPEGRSFIDKLGLFNPISEQSIQIKNQTLFFKTNFNSRDRLILFKSSNFTFFKVCLHKLLKLGVFVYFNIFMWRKFSSKPKKARIFLTLNVLGLLYFIKTSPIPLTKFVRQVAFIKERNLLRVSFFLKRSKEIQLEKVYINNLQTDYLLKRYKGCFIYWRLMDKDHILPLENASYSNQELLMSTLHGYKIDFL